MCRKTLPFGYGTPKYQRRRQTAAFALNMHQFRLAERNGGDSLSPYPFIERIPKKTVVQRPPRLPYGVNDVKASEVLLLCTTLPFKKVNVVGSGAYRKPEVKKNTGSCKSLRQYHGQLPFDGKLKERKVKSKSKKVPGEVLVWREWCKHRAVCMWCKDATIEVISSVRELRNDVLFFLCEAAGVEPLDILWGSDDLFGRPRPDIDFSKTRRARQMATRPSRASSGNLSGKVKAAEMEILGFLPRPLRKGVKIPPPGWLYSVCGDGPWEYISALTGIDESSLKKPILMADPCSAPNTRALTSDSSGTRRLVMRGGRGLSSYWFEKVEVNCGEVETLCQCKTPSSAGMSKNDWCTVCDKLIECSHLGRNCNYFRVKVNPYMASSEGSGYPQKLSMAITGELKVELARLREARRPPLGISADPTTIAIEDDEVENYAPDPVPGETGFDPNLYSPIKIADSPYMKWVKREYFMRKLGYIWTGGPDAPWNRRGGGE
jgi:hypothetical protein